MGLEIQRGKSRWWYGRVVINGRSLSRNLGVEIKGAIPKHLAKQGDAEFERPRKEALFAFHKFEIELKSRKSAEELIQTIHEIRTGERIQAIPLDECAAKWAELPRRRPLAERYLSSAQRTIARFITFIRANHKGVQAMDQVQVRMARAFVREEDKRGIAAATYNKNLILLRSVFESLRREAGMAENPFTGIPTRDGDSIFRKPFSVEELELIIKAAEADPFIYPLIITGACTAMRKGDCCTLLRSAVDMAAGFISVKTSKTGESIQIPIFPLLRGVLEKALAVPTTRAPFYVFPNLEAHYKINPDHLTDRVKRVIKAAGFFDPDDESDPDGPESRGALSADREHGLRRASLRDFHSFRVTWVTLALTAGVPMEVVKKVTGHRTADIVMKHDFQPGRQEFRRTLATKLPPILGGRNEAPALASAELRERLIAMTAQTWQAIRDELLGRLPGEPKPVIDVVADPGSPKALVLSA
ncbi:MAG TPA: tyrosine-type recombinase/integrase [Candidatus Didemnitutus sp.]|jgi:integrase